MKIQSVLQELDHLFETYKIDKVEPFLMDKFSEAASQKDTNSVITLLNEMIGFYRDTSQYEKALNCCKKVISIMEDEKMAGTIPYATTLQNVANAYRAAGKSEESMAYYQTVFKLYEGILPQNDFRYASLYNNMSLLYQEMKEFEKSSECLENALKIVTQYPDARIETAVTYTNLATSELKLHKGKEAVSNLEKAFKIFEMNAHKDYHFSAALSSMGEAKYMEGRLEESISYYKRALTEIYKNVGKTAAYEITLQNLNQVEQELGVELTVPKIKGLKLCQNFYEIYGIPMIHDLFSKYEDVIAVGLVGQGSDCFGFDDDISKDHDYGPGFCLWLTDDVYNEIGIELREAYDKLPTIYGGIKRQITRQGSHRVGVFKIGGFYRELIGMEGIPTTENEWLFLEDYQLASATNGKVFRDDTGEFSAIRNGLLQYYPEEVRVKKIVKTAALMAQSGQYNYNRMLKRGEKVTAQITLSKFMEYTMEMVYLLNRQYAPFYKWMHRGLDELPILPEIMDILNAIADMPAGDERISMTIEIIATLIIDELKKQGLTTGDDNYLDRSIGHQL